MKARMEEIAIFYNDNLDDEKIQFFEKLRLKIKKALHNRPGKNSQEVDYLDTQQIKMQLSGGF